ncbi:hypothetical protein Psyc_1700 [Psychrobacter arcticus 273-4]|uniref:SH3 domain protein n=1 Tax=Psychrobacter arcticus (strain DSM 17307 / VKM B-2377 / 273-4) TaxID=259536 RepID=Q4FR10_PSYA2|nr:hypothetical protein [Psychrobacter arcticus]AAZ19548.1 hypothetical protein Psyc_1700 [Psychrobacter arcticus 273-4]
MIQRLLSLKKPVHKTGFANTGLAIVLLIAAVSVHAAPTVTAQTDSVSGIAPVLIAANHASQTQTTAPVIEMATAAKPATNINDTLAAQLQPSNKALSAANQELLSRNAQLQRQVNDLQTQANVLVYESKGQLFLYGAFTVLLSLLVGIFISWLVFVRRERW